MNRLKNIFLNKSEKIIPYITAGYPELNSTIKNVLEAVKGGADMVEIGMPYSDPLADGPTIQESSQIALDNGIHSKLIFEQVKEIRLNTHIPLVLMGYINPIIKYGQKKFLVDCFNSGIDGLIIPDLPPEEAEDFLQECNDTNISLIFLIAPNTSIERIRYISSISINLIYCVSILGITGSEISNRKKLKNYLIKVKKNIDVPFIVGFGISNYNDVKFINSIADGAVVGSSLISEIKNNIKNYNIKKYVKTLKGNDE